VVRVGKRKAVALELEEEDVDELAEDGVDVKWVKTLSDEQLNVEGPVSLLFCSKYLFLLTDLFIVRSMCWAPIPATMHC